MDLAGKHAVVGGQEDAYGMMNIGRIFASGETRVGKVNTFWIQDAAFYYIENQQEKIIKSYEILVYKEKTDEDIEFTAQKLFGNL